METVWVHARGPASLSNLGPGFDALGLCIDTHFDVVSVRRIPEDHIVVEASRGVTPTDPTRNTAAVAARSVLNAAGASGGLHIRINKGIPIGSGIGGSAASAAAAVVATNSVLGDPFARADLAGPAIDGEFVASGARHGDNVLPALFGGFIVTNPDHPEDFQRLDVGSGFSIALLLPQQSILTTEARRLLPTEVPFSDVRGMAAGAAAVVAALVRGDAQGLGRAIMSDRVVEPVRRPLVHGYMEARLAALNAGAAGFAMSGSGPAMFAVTEDDEAARVVADAMVEAVQSIGAAAEGFVAQTNNVGAIVTEV